MYLKQCEVESRVEYFKGDIQEILKAHKVIKKWAYILHDKDDTAPHYHIYLNFGSSGVDTSQVGAWFGLQESQVSRVKGRAEVGVGLVQIAAHTGVLAALTGIQKCKFHAQTLLIRWSGRYQSAMVWISRMRFWAPAHSSSRMSATGRMSCSMPATWPAIRLPVSVSPSNTARRRLPRV